MKKFLFSLIVIASLASCKKETSDCKWYDSLGNGWYDHPPTPAEKQALEQQCGCTVTFSKQCD